MFNDRDLYILSGGGLLAVVCLLPSWPFALKVSLAILIMVLALIIALMRFGKDRNVLEKHLYYSARYSFMPKLFSYFGRGATSVSSSGRGSRANTPVPSTIPITLAWDDMNVYLLMTVWLAVIGIYFVVWLRNTGQLELALWIRQLSIGR